MGAAEGKEQSVGKLLTEKESWKDIINEFLKEPYPSNNNVDYKVDIAVLEILCEILAEQLQDLQYGSVVENDINNIFEAICRLLSSKFLYRQLVKKQECARFIFQSGDGLTSNKKVLGQALKAFGYLLEFHGDSPEEEAWYEAETKKFFFADERYLLLLELLVKYNDGNGDIENENIIKFVLSNISSFMISRQHTTLFEDLEKFLADALKPEYMTQFLQLLHHRNIDIRAMGVEIFKQMMLEIQFVNFKYVQNMAREQGEILWQAIYSLTESPGDDQAYNNKQMESSIQVISFLCDGNTRNIRVMENMFPDGIGKKWALVNYDLEPWLPANAVNADADNRPKNARLSKQQKKESAQKMKFAQLNRRNWNKLFNEILRQDYCEPTLVWNAQTRSELVEALRNEINELQSICRLTGHQVTWEDSDFEVRYSSLDPLLFVRPYYLEVLMQWLSARQNIAELANPTQFMDELVAECVIEDDNERKHVLLKAMKQLFLAYEDEFQIFKHMPYLVWLLSPKHCNTIWKESLLLLLKKLFYFTENIRSFVKHKGIEIAIAHLQQLPKADSSEQSLMGINIMALLEAVCVFPRSRKLLTTDEKFQYIVQMLLCDEIDIVNQAIMLISHILETNPHIHPFLYKTGIFSFIMRLMNHRCSLATAMLLKQFHGIQAHREGEDCSFLEYFLPAPFISVLEKENGAESFCQIMSSDYISKPDLYWNKNMRESLVSQINQGLQDFIYKLKEDPTILYQYSQPNIIEYTDLETKLCIGNIYVENFCELPHFHLRDPQLFLLDLIDNLSSESDAQFMLLNLQAQKELFKRYGTQKAFIRYTGMEILCSILVSLMENEMSQIDLQIGSKICDLLCSVFKYAVSVKSTYNKDVFFKSEVASYLVTVASELLNVENQTNEHKEFVSFAVALLGQISTESTIQILLTQMETFFYDLGTLYSQTLIQDMPEISLRVLDATRKFAKCEALQTRMVENACMFALLEVAVLYQPNEKDNQFQAQKACILTAIKALAKLSQNNAAANVLKQCLTVNLFYSIAEDEELFLKTARNNVQTPLIIWNDEIRHELKNMLEKQFTILNGKNGPVMFEPQEFAFTLEYLANEMVINNVYVRVFNKNPTKNIGSRSKFCSELLYSLYEDYTTIKDQIQLFDESQDNSPLLDSIELCLVKIEAFQKLLKHHPSASEAIPLVRHNPLSDLMVLFMANRDLLLSNMPSAFARTLTALMDAHNRIVNTDASLCIQFILIPLHYILIAEKQFPISRNQVLCMLSRAVSKSNEMAQKMITTGFLVSVFISLLDVANFSLLDRSQSAKIVWSIAVNEETRQQMQQILRRVFNPKFEEIASVNKDNAIDFVMSLVCDDHETPLSIWNEDVRSETLSILQKSAEPILSHIKNVTAMKNRDEFEWTPSMIPVDYWERNSLSAEIRVYSIYVRCFNESPFFSLSSPSEFLKQLFARITLDYRAYQQDLRIASEPASPRTLATSNLIILWEAVKNVILNSPHLKADCKQEAPLICSNFKHRESKKLLASVVEVLALLVENDEFVSTLANKVLLADIMRGIHLLPNSQTMLNVVNTIVTLNHEAIREIKQVGGLFYMINVILNSRERKLRETCAEILSKMIKNYDDDSMAEGLCEVLTPKFATWFEKKPDKFIDFFDNDHTSEERVWNSETREKLGSIVQQQTERISEARFTSDLPDMDLHEMAQAEVTKFWSLNTDDAL